MSFDLFTVLALLAACIVLFIINKPRMDVVALLVIMAMPLLGILSVPEALAGFSDPNVLLIAALFVIGEGLVRTGVAYQLGDYLAAWAGSSEVRLLTLLMLLVAGLGSVMSSTGVVAIFIPVVLGVARSLRIHPRRLMMPLSFAGLISGMMTLVATPPNMVVDSALRQDGHGGFGFFSFTPFGLVILFMGVGYMLVARHWLSGGESGHAGNERRSLLDLVEAYHLAGREHRLRVSMRSPLVGQMLQEWKPRDHHGANIIAIERQVRLRTELVYPRADTRILAGDILLVDIPAVEGEDAPDLSAELRLETLPLRGSYFTDQSREMGMAEVMLPPDSTLLDKSILDIGFRRKYQLHVIGLRRKSKGVEGNLLEEKLRQGDMLLVMGPWKAIRQLQQEPRDFLVLSLPVEVDQVAPALRQAPYALLGLGVMVTLMITGLVPNVIAALIGCLIMGWFRCIDMESSYKSIHWQSLIVIVGMMPFALALQRTGGIDLAVEGIFQLFGDATPRLLLAALFVLTAVIGLCISNTATAVLMAPIAIGMASHLGVSPYPFAITVALAASAAFMTPISSPVNILVLGPGQYKFFDFVKVGVPFTILVLLVTVLMVPVLFPL